MTPEKRKRALAIKGLIEQGWSPPRPSNAVALRIIEDISLAGRFGETNDLSPREAGLLQLLADGHTAESAAEEMRLTVETVKSMMKGVRQKLGARNTPHAVAIAFRAGLLDLDEAVAA